VSRPAPAIVRERRADRTCIRPPRGSRKPTYFPYVGIGVFLVRTSSRGNMQRTWRVQLWREHTQDRIYLVRRTIPHDLPVTGHSALSGLNPAGSPGYSLVRLLGAARFHLVGCGTGNSLWRSPEGTKQPTPERGTSPTRRSLTVKLRGRAPTSDRGRGPILSPGSRGPKQTTPHGPLQRWLEGMLPPQAPRYFSWSEHVMKDSPRRLGRGLRRGMEQERAHRDKTTPRRNTCDLS
jgi:hypothetical protein